VVRHIGDQQARQRSDRHLDQEAHRHVVGLELWSRPFTDN
jgi:hypothetical protein